MDNDAADSADRGVSDGPAREDAAWRDLVARLMEPLPAEPGPWPELENVPPPGSDAGLRDDRPRIIRPARPGSGGPGPEASGPALPAGFRDGDPPGDPGDADGDADYVRPPAPPLPSLDPMTKGAWLALFGGPGYLFLATMLGWQVAGWAALTAIAAFVAGFAVLVIRLGDGPSRRDDPDQGAVV